MFCLNEGLQVPAPTSAVYAYEYLSSFGKRPHCEIETFPCKANYRKKLFACVCL